MSFLLNQLKNFQKKHMMGRVDEVCFYGIRCYLSSILGREVCVSTEGAAIL